MKRLHSAEMRRQRVLGMYGTGYAVRWAVSPKGRAGLMTPDRDALSALRRNLPDTPEERGMKEHKTETAEMSGEPHPKICDSNQGTSIRQRIIYNLCHFGLNRIFVNA